MNHSDGLNPLNGIAIVGLSGRFPGAKNVNEFWQNLQNGVESITFFTDEELTDSGVDPALLNHPNYVKAAPILDDVEQFDAAFFDCSATEAQYIDPEHRLFLECAWESLEIAGYSPEVYDGSIGVYAGGGSGSSSYLLSTYYITQILNGVTGSLQHLGNDKDYLATRVSYKLNLTGPSLTIQTACSTSLVAIHTACQSLLNGECDMALAGGSSIRFPHRSGYLLDEEIGLVSPDGHCRAFDATGEGTIFGSGVGVVVLKRLSEAIADRDYIYGVIKGSAINNDGGKKVSYTTSSVEGKARAIAEAIAVADVDPETIGYVEASATGTRLGDKSEVDALTQVFRSQTQKQGFCAIGSVKTNVGHLEGAAGVTGLIKAVLALHHQQIPPHLHFENPNPDIDFDNSPFYVNRTLTPWENGDTPRRAGVTALGFGGTNAHVVLEEAPVLEPAVNTLERPLHLINLSAKTETALQTMAQQYADYLTAHPTANLGDIGLTTQLGRSHFNHRLAIVAGSPTEAQEQLTALMAGQPTNNIISGEILPRGSRKLAFLFSQTRPQMNTGRQLYETQPNFRKAMVQCDALLRAYLGESLLPLLYPDLFAAEPQPERLGQSPYTEAASFALAYATAELWNVWGVVPSAMVAQGWGEYAAACVAGIFDLKTAVKLLTLALGLHQTAPEDLGVTLSSGKIDILFPETGESAIAHISSLDYWLNRNSQSPSMEMGIQVLNACGYQVFVEISSQPECKIVLPEAEGIYLPSLNPQQSDWQQLLTSLATLYVNGIPVNWAGFNQDYSYRRIPLPTYPFERQRYWIDPPENTETVSINSSVAVNKILPRPNLNNDYVAPTDELERRIVAIWQNILNVEPIGIEDRFFDLGGDSMNGLRALNQLQEELGEIIHISALFDAPTVTQLATYLRTNYGEAVVKMLGLEVEQTDQSSLPKVEESTVQQFRQLIHLLPAKNQPSEPKNPPAVFILSPPRSGSTLLRVILAGHPQLFAPPELHLLSFWTLAQQKAAFSERNEFWLEGCLRAIMQIHNCDVEAARQLMQELEDQQFTTQQFYRWMQLQMPNQLLVDKTPFYAFDINMLKRAEQEFKNAKFIHLKRHPGGMIRSYEKAKLDLLGQFGGEGVFPRQQLAELTWLVSHQNILEFLQEIPSERQYSLRFEDLVRQPENTIKGMCQFLGLDVHPDMMQPYNNKGQRMTDGVQSNSRMIGDVKFHQYKGIEAKVADSWRKHFNPEKLGEITQDLAESFGYPAASKPAQINTNPDKSSLVLLKSGGSKPPLFVIHDGDGELLPYLQLGHHLDTERPLYGLRPHSRDGYPILHTRIEDMAAYYIEQIRTVQPQGPYLIGGLCAGGVIAFEMAVQLQAQGEDVPVVVLMDSMDAKTPLQGKNQKRLNRLSEALSDSSEYNSIQKLFYLTNTVAQKAKNVMVYETQHKINTTRNHLQLSLYRAYLDKGQKLPSFLQNIDVRTTFMFAKKGYVPKVYRGQLLLLKATEALILNHPTINDEPYSNLTPDILLGWGKRSTQGVEWHQIPGGHSSMLQDPHVQILADKLETYIRTHVTENHLVQV
jgi:acyl transferase domain-containing protein/thioesterase domain-containing protein